MFFDNLTCVERCIWKQLVALRQTCVGVLIPDSSSPRVAVSFTKHWKMYHHCMNIYVGEVLHVKHTQKNHLWWHSQNEGYMYTIWTVKICFCVFMETVGCQIKGWQSPFTINNPNIAKFSAGSITFSKRWYNISQNSARAMYIYLAPCPSKWTIMLLIYIHFQCF